MSRDYYDATNKLVPVSPVQAGSSNFGSPDGSACLEGMRSGSEPVSGRAVDDLFAAISGRQRWMAKIDLNKGDLEQTFDRLASHVLAFETGAISASGCLCKSNRIFVASAWTGWWLNSYWVACDFHVSSHITLHRAQMSKKKRKIWKQK